MEPNQALASLTAKALKGLNDYLAEHNPDLVVVQGDTTTTFCAALAAFYNQIPVAHVEAGLRTGNKLSPYPEEINRALTTRLAEYHFAPTGWAKENLLSEGIAEEQIFVTGNTGVDAIELALANVRARQIPIFWFWFSVYLRGDSPARSGVSSRSLCLPGPPKSECTQTCV